MHIVIANMAKYKWNKNGKKKQKKTSGTHVKSPTVR